MAVVLVVEQDRYQKLLVTEELEREGHRVVAVDSGEEALDGLADLRPDLVVVEIRLPGMSGLELIERLVERDEGLPVVIHTASAGHEGRGIACVADAYVLKSSDPSTRVVFSARMLSLPFMRTAPFFLTGWHTVVRNPVTH